MSQTIRTILLTAVQETAPELRRAITSLSEIRIVADLDDPAVLPQAVAQFPADLVVVDLDPDPAPLLASIAKINELAPVLPVFAVSVKAEGNIVLQAMRAGVKEYLLKPLKPDEFEQAVSRVISFKSKTKERGKQIAIMGSAGGVGCTTIASNLAVELAELVTEPHRVCLVDFDFRFGHCATLLDLQGQFTIADLCNTPGVAEVELIKRALIRHESGILVLRRPHTFAQADTVTAAHCSAILSAIQDICDYVVIDGPIRQDPGGRTIIDAADLTFLVVQLLVTSVRNADRMLQELAGQGFNTDRIRLICNRVSEENAFLDLNQVETTLGRKIFAAIADDPKSVNASINIGQPLRTEFDRSKVRQNIHTLAMKIHCPEAIPAEANKWAGLQSLTKLFRKGGNGTHELTGTSPATAG